MGQLFLLAPRGRGTVEFLQKVITSAECRQCSSSPWKLAASPACCPAVRMRRVCSTSKTPCSQNTSMLSTCNWPLSTRRLMSGNWTLMMSLVASSDVLPLINDGSHHCKMTYTEWLKKVGCCTVSTAYFFLSHPVYLDIKTSKSSSRCSTRQNDGNMRHQFRRSLTTCCQTRNSQPFN